MAIGVCACVIRLVSEHGEELKVEELSKGLKVLAKQVKDSSYRDVMKLLRLLLSGLQVRHHSAVQLMLANTFKSLPQVWAVGGVIICKVI